MHTLHRRIKYYWISSASVFVKVWLILTFILLCNCLSYTSASDVNSLDSLQYLLNSSSNTIKDADKLLNGAKSLYYSNPELAKEYSSKALKIYEKNRQLEGVANSSNSVGACYYALGHNDKALYYYEQAYSLNEKSDNLEGMAKNLNNIGNIYLKIGKLEKALEYFYQSLTIYKNINDREGIITMYNNIGLIYESTGSFEKALDTYNKGLAEAEKIGSKLDLGIIYYNISLIYMEQEEYFRAITACEKSQQICEEINDKSGLIFCLSALGRIYYYINDFPRSDTYFEEALVLAKELNNKEEVANLLQHIAYNSLKKESYTRARDLFLKSLEIADELQLEQLQHSNYEYLAEVDSLMGNFKSAMGYQQKFFLSKPAEENFSVEDKLKELQEKYEFTRKENIVVGKKLQKSKSLISSLLCVLIILLLVGLIFILQIRLKAEKRITDLTQQNLRSQMNPHFIFNVLNSIHYYILKNDSEASGNYLTKFAKLLRLTLDNSRANLVSINDELESLKLYLELEAMRLENNLEYDIEIDEEIDSYMFKIPTLLLQPFVENSIVHGIQKKEGTGKVHIEMKLREKTIHCLIEDNGIGREKADDLKSGEQKSRTSHGSNITQTRLNLLNSLYGRKLGIEYSDLTDENKLPCGTRVEFDLPILN